MLGVWSVVAMGEAGGVDLRATVGTEIVAAFSGPQPRSFSSSFPYVSPSSRPSRPISAVPCKQS